MKPAPMRRKSAPGHAYALIPYLNTCPVHGKHTYATRKDAKAVCKQMANPDVDPYPCDTQEGMWHIGSSHRLKDARRGGPPPGVRS